MAAMTDYLENKLIDFLFRGQSFVPSSSLYVGLLSATPTDSSAGTEVTGNAYARVAVISGLDTWAATQGFFVSSSSGNTGTTVNTGTVSFPVPAPSGWGTVVATGIWDAASGGNLLFYGALSASKTINASDTVTFPGSALSFQIDN